MSGSPNRYSAGYSSEDALWVRRRCACCRLPFEYETPRDGVQVRDRCEPCEEHFAVEGEPGERALARASEHEARLRAWADGAVLAVTAAERETRAAQERARYAEGLRDRWRDLAVAMSAGHEDDGSGECGCGQAWPCRTARVALGADRGLARELAARRSATGTGS